MPGISNDGHGEREYPIGWTIRFLDDSATVPPEDVGQRMVLAVGIINGEAFDLPDGAKGIPTWVRRQGRSATTVNVHESNVIDVSRGKIP